MATVFSFTSESWKPFRLVEGRGSDRGRGRGRGSSSFEGAAADVASTAISSCAGVGTGFGE